MIYALLFIVRVIIVHLREGIWHGPVAAAPRKRGKQAAQRAATTTRPPPPRRGEPWFRFFDVAALWLLMLHIEIPSTCSTNQYDQYHSICRRGQISRHHHHHHHTRASSSHAPLGHSPECRLATFHRSYRIAQGGTGDMHFICSFADWCECKGVDGVSPLPVTCNFRGNPRSILF